MTNADLLAKRTVRLTTRGRKSGQPRTVTVWFVPSGANGICVQHSSRKSAHWYRNLLQDPRVELDFGGGPVQGHALAVTDEARIAEILRGVRRKYPLAWVFQLLGWGRRPVAAEIKFDR
jgi:deazaflavin-dependent oxidoreductase (nitroreductase family)